MITIYIPGLPQKSYEYRRGDSQIIHDDKNNAIVIDGGEPDLFNKIKAYCKNKGITHITLIITHWHYDHDIAMKEFLEVAGIFVDKIFCPNPAELAGLGDPDAVEDRARAGRRISQAKSLNKPIVYPTAGKVTEIKVGDIRCQMWRRAANKGDKNDYEVNNTSICTYFPDLYYLTTGDTINAFDIYLNTKPGTIKVFKIPHHGNACTTNPCKLLKAAGAELCWYNDWEKKGTAIGSSGFSRYGAGYCKSYFTTLRTDADIVMTAANKKLIVQKNNSIWNFNIPYDGNGSAGWQKNGDKWSYQYEDGTYAVSWNQLDWSGGKDWFYFNENGIMLTGWYFDKGFEKWYYLDPENGTMQKDKAVQVNGYWYYLNEWGQMRIGWYTAPDGKDRYLEPDAEKNQGHMYVNCEADIDGKRYVFDGYGRVVEQNGGNSSLISYTYLSPNHSGKRIMPIDRITPHCAVGQLSCESLAKMFLPKAKEASCNYCIGTEGKIALVVDEQNRSWCSSNRENDQRAVTIECASDSTSPYAFNETVYNRLIDLCVDICERNDKVKLTWFGDKEKTLSYNPPPNECVLTVHRWFENKSCPGDWMYVRMGDLANKVTARLQGAPISEDVKPYRVRKSANDVKSQIGAFNSLDNAKALAAKNAGYHVYDATGKEII